ncbi:unnamed protein product [Rotaria sp. Silwood1]|nr:unnamed protein product [Rotaria sp. Silwood1]
MAHDKILFERSNVFIKDRLSQTEKQAASLDEIKGTITIFENERGKFFNFKPFGLEDSMTDDWALVNGGKSIVSFKNRSNDKDSIAVSASPLLKFRYYFNINNLRSIRRHHLLHGIAYLIIVLKDGTTLPAFHFNLGGSRELLQLFIKHLKLEKSTQDSQIYIAKDDLPQENITESISVFDQLNLFDDSSSMMKRIRGSDSRRTAIERFSKVTNFLKDAFLGQNDFIPMSDNPDGTMGADVTALMESFNRDLRESNNDGFEVIYKVDFKNLPEVTRNQSLTSKEWQMFFDKDGRIIDVKKVKERIFRGGLESNILRRDIWKFLLNYYPWSSTHDERIELVKQKESEYFAMKLQWKTMNEQQKQRNSLFRERESLIDKDVIRTDRTHEYFQGDNNVHLEVLHDVLMTYNMFNFDLGYVQGMNDLLSPILIVMDNEVDAFWYKDVIRTDRTHEYFQGDNNIHLEVLHDVLMTYNMFNFDLGYVQGMNDLLSPILIVMDNEVDAFWCFVGLMERMEQNFHMDQSHITRQLSNLHTLLQFVDAELANYLGKKSKIKSTAR